MWRKGDWRKDPFCTLLLLHRWGDTGEDKDGEEEEEEEEIFAGIKEFGTKGLLAKPDQV